MAWPRGTRQPRPAFKARVDDLQARPWFQERVTLVRAGLSWSDTGALSRRERLAFIRAFNAQEETAEEDAQSRARVGRSEPDLDLDDA